MAVLPTLDNLRGLLQKVIFVPIVYGFISLLPMFLTGWENSDRLADRLLSMVRSNQNTFDFIVVGGGTAGALVANRLAEHYRVLLLEAGGTPMPFQTIPALALKFLNHPQTDWSHKTVPQRKACLNSINQQSSWSAGRGLGGTSNIGFMSHLRGHANDFEKWAEITGDPSWGYSSLLPFFKRYETFSGTSNDPEARGHDGELRIRKPNYIGLSEDWVRAGQELGYPFVDLNGRHEEGFGILQYPIYKGGRQSTYAAFLLPVHKSPRLTIRRYALVRKVLFRDMNNQAYAVEYVRHGKIETAIATKEVVLSAGTLGSSKLLMLSGIGPKAHLEELGIPVRSDLPVGRNLIDHLGVHLGPFFIKEPKSFLFDRDVTPENFVRWLFLGTGPITTTGYQGAASIASSVAKSRGEGNWPDLHLMLHGQAIHQGYTDAFAYAYGLQEDELMQYYHNAVGQDSFHIYVIGARPTSTGQVLLSGASIADPLVINPKYLEDGGDGDFRILLEGVKTAMNIANTSMFQRLGTEFTKTKLPGCQDMEVGTDEYWECYIRRFTLTMHNPVGTVALGAVLDPTLKVHGTRGLRVIDASVQPTVVSTGTAASTLMIAEKGVDFILKDHGIPDRDQDLYDVLFGKNGFFKKNPILRILQREFDLINPLRALFKPFTARRNEDDGEWGEDVKERFTRNGGIDNPFLQVISTVFGNANLDRSQSHQVDNSVEGRSSTISTSFIQPTSSAPPPPPPSSTFQKRSNENYLFLEDSSTGNVLSKNQWVLQAGPVKASNAGPSHVISFGTKKVAVVNSTTGLNSKELSILSKKTKGKGGKRFQLLQQILKMESENKPIHVAMLTVGTPVPLKSTTPVTTVLPTTPSFATTTTATSPIPSDNTTPVEEVPVVKQMNATKNELFSNTSALQQPPPLVAKPISIDPPPTPSLYGLFPPLNRPYGLRSPPTTANPLSELIKSINSFGSLVSSLTAKDKHLLTPKPLSLIPSGEKETLFKVSPSQNLFHGGGNNGNIFNFLTNFNNNNKTGTGSGSTIQPFPILTTIPNNNNPFQFLFGGQQAPVTLPISTTTTTASTITSSTTTKSPLEDVSSAVGVAGGNGDVKFVKNDLPKVKNISPKQQQPNLFSDWLKPFFSPPSKSQPSSTSSPWFKPFENKPLTKGGFQQSSSTWPHPFNQNTKSTFDSNGGSSSSSGGISSWFKPFNFTANNDKSSSTSSWFKPFKPQQIKSSTNNIFPIAPTLKSPSPTATSSDPFGTIFELVFGGLKKQERRAIYKTLNTMLEAGESIADLLGAPAGSTVGSMNSLMSAVGGSGNRANLDFLKQISKGKRTASDDDRDKDDDYNYVELLKSLIAMNQVIDSYHSSKKPSSSSAAATKISDNSLEEFLSTFNYPSPPPSPSSWQTDVALKLPPSNSNTNSTSSLITTPAPTTTTTTTASVTVTTVENSETTMSEMATTEQYEEEST